MHTLSRSKIALCKFALLAAQLPCCLSAEAAPRFEQVLFQDDFRSGLGDWRLELEKPGSVVARDGALEIDVPAGATVWFKRELSGRIAIEYKATAVSARGANDRVSDLNCFWMATNKDGTSPIGERSARSGKFADYNDLLTYYVGLGGNTNTTTRFRRYIGDPVQRPLLPQHDLNFSDALLAANQEQKITLVADGAQIEYWRNGSRLFSYADERPYVSGWFAIRTTQSHLRIRDFKVYRLGQ